MNRFATVGGGVVAATFALLLAPASAYTMVVGGSHAQACFQYSDRGLADGDTLTECTLALSEGLSDHDRAATYVNRGVVLLRRGDESGAMADFDAAISIAPDVAEAHTNRGSILLGRHDYAGAVASISRGLELGPSDPQIAYLNRAIAYEEMHNFRSAYEDYRRASELAPSWDLPRVELARFQVR